MKSGEMLLWFDNDPTLDFRAKIERAIAYYLKKYGKSPNLCLINAKLEVVSDNLAIKILKDEYILPHHFWIGISCE